MLVVLVIFNYFLVADRPGVTDSPCQKLVYAFRALAAINIREW